VLERPIRYPPGTMGVMRHRALACDYDGTLATDGVCAPATIAGLERIAGSGMRLILVTGRTREELEAVFDRCDLFDAIVVENGAVVIEPATGEERLLAPRLPRALVEELQRIGVHPLVIGRVLCSTDVSQRPKLLAAISKLGTDRQVVRNRDSAMVLPHGISKRTGFDVALRMVDEPASAAVAVGDGENDVALFAAAGVSVAVANAVEELKLRADVVLTQPNGKGVADLVEALLAGDLGALTALSPLAG
jgi:hydroxymethylpyrimidine pyrophosphatase-like HAD family hydrolase